MKFNELVKRNLKNKDLSQRGFALVELGILTAVIIFLVLGVYYLWANGFLNGILDWLSQMWNGRKPPVS